MAILRGRQIAELVELLKAQGAHLYHACQLQDFQSYVELGGIPSRELLEFAEMPFTPFASDAEDKKNDVWGLVFGNLEDFGGSFAMGRWGARDGGAAFVPTVYGPITIQLRPDALLEAENVAVSLVSGAQAGFSRHRDSLAGPAAVAACFSQGKFLKSAKDLARENNLPHAIHPEWSIECPGRLLSFDAADLIRVEPMSAGGKPLFDFVEAAANSVGVKVFERNKFAEGRRELLQGLASIVESGRHWEELLLEKGAPETLLEYLGKVKAVPSSRKQFARFVQYLSVGTLEPARSMTT